MIKKCQGLLVAESILNILNSMFSSDDKVDNWVECFDNCREQGYVIKTGNTNIAFCENRNSDNIVVYKYKEVKFPSNLPANDENWRDRKFFRYDEIYQAARYIKEVILKACKEQKEEDEKVL